MNFSFFSKFRNKHADEEALRGISEAVDQFQSAPPAWDTSKMGEEQQVEERILGRLMLSVNERPKQHRLHVRKIATWSAAAAVLTFCVVAALYKDTWRTGGASPLIVAEAKAAHHEKLTLPDGSTVVLNAGSRLSYPKKFGNQREVTLLEGEAYFDVKQDAKKPFIVKADKISTTVLGTSFNIRAYHFIPDVTVTVSGGKVSVNNAYILTPDQQVSYAKSTGVIQQKAVKAAEVLGWMDGKLLFTNETFRQVAGLLENKYNVDIIIDDETISSYHFTGAFEASETLNDVLDALTLTKGLQYSIKDTTIHISQTKK
ncbi:FecR domain-containing protein [uncultured Chitinophaga sp.]|uniref:FecR family protein n=1 Tax=uncultured Chitinophaga sp. TaxID=339340 RepID=UPI0025F86E3C|nr:FecR domain-containing protein [uncultured Chitinophaga sp.]